MAPTHSLYSSPRIPHHDHVPHTSPALQMPNVFVVPPEEDQSPPFCCFDATEAPPLESTLSTMLDIDFLDGALGVLRTESQAPLFHRDSDGPFGSQNTVILPRKNIEARSIDDMSAQNQYFDLDDDMEVQHDETQCVPNGGTRREVGEDSEIVEVVKVRRRTQHNDIQTKTPEIRMKSTKSLKSRASKAFKSLRNVGKGSIRSKHPVHDAFAPPLVAADDPPFRARTPTMSRRGSVILSQIFNGHTPLKSRPSVSSFEAPLAERPTLTLQSPIDDHFPPHNEPLPSLDAPKFPLASPPLQSMDHVDDRSPSPTPSMVTLSTKRRFSVLSLQRLWSFSSDNGVEDVPRSTPAMSRTSSGPSTASSLGPDTPTEESIPIPPAHNFHPEDNRKPYSHPGTAANPLIAAPGDASFEMRLDSLHFDSLSFDADRF